MRFIHIKQRLQSQKKLVSVLLALHLIMASYVYINTFCSNVGILHLITKKLLGITKHKLVLVLSDKRFLELSSSSSHTCSLSEFV